jgi:hypothetical protein
VGMEAYPPPRNSSGLQEWVFTPLFIVSPTNLQLSA